MMLLKMPKLYATLTDFASWAATSITKEKNDTYSSYGTHIQLSSKPTQKPTDAEPFTTKEDTTTSLEAN